MDQIILKITLNNFCVDELELIDHLSNFRTGKGIQARALEIKRLMKAGLEANVRTKPNPKIAPDQVDFSNRASNSDDHFGSQNAMTLQANQSPTLPPRSLEFPQRYELDLPSNSKLFIENSELSKHHIGSVESSTSTAMVVSQKVAVLVDLTQPPTVEAGVAVEPDAIEIGVSVTHLFEQYVPPTA